MATHLALNLTHDAITLLHDSGAGWFELGSARLDAEDFAQQLAALRATAAQVGGLEYHTSLVLPESQILFTSASATGQDADADEQRVRETLEGATPYPVSELAYDWVLQDDRLRIAVVALETLGEAEAFAEENGFRPVHFTAIPPGGTFETAPWFGATARASEIVKGGADRPEAMPPIAIVGALSADDVAELIAARKAHDAPPTPEADAPAKAAPDDTDTTAATSTPTDGTPAEAPPESALTDAPEDNTPEEEDTTAQDTPPAFSSLRAAKPASDASDKAALDSPAKTAATSAQTPAPRMPPAPPRVQTAGDTPALDDVAFDDAEDLSDDSPVAFTSIRPRRDTAAPAKPAAPALPPPPVLKEPEAAPSKTGPKIPAAPATSAEGFAQSVAPSLSARREDAKRPPADAEKTSKLGGLMSRIKTAAPAPKAPAAPAERPADPPPENREAENLTVFGARAGQQDQGAAPGRAGLFVTGTIIIVLLVIGVWAGVAYRTEIEAWLRGAPPPTSVASLPPAFEADGDSLIAPAQPTAPPAIALPARPTAPATLPTPPQTLPAPAPDRPTAQSTPDLPQTGTADQRLARLSPAPPAALPQRAAPDATDDTITDADTDLLADSEPDVIVLTPQQVRARYAATGVWQAAPQQPQTGVETGISRLYLAAIDPVILGADAVDLPRDLRRLRDEPPPRQSNPPAPGADILLGADGLVTPTPGGTLNPDGILVYSGAPPSGPPPRRPGLTDPPITGTSPAISIEQRPRTRPAALAENAQRSQLGGRTLQELSFLRPRTRPDSVIETAAAQRAEAEIVAAQEAAELAVKQRAEAEAAGRADASPLAVLASLNPRARPADLAPPPQADSTQSGSSGPAVVRSQRVQPAAPTPVSVARQATIDNGIRLNRMNLIGIFGTPNDRRALVRLPSGRLLRLKVGDRLDGGRVGAIGDDALRYTKGGRDITLEMPRG